MVCRRDDRWRYAISLLDTAEHPNAEAPLHVHHREDEGFLILEGRVTLYVGDDVAELGPGDFGWGPRDVPHRYMVGREGCRMLFLCTPAGFEKLVIGMSTPAESLTLPPPSDQEPDGDHIAAVAAAGGCELLA